MYSAIHKGRSQTEEERERERWIRDPCGRCTDINESPGYYCGQFPHRIRSSAFRVLRVSPWKQAVHHRPTETIGFYSTSDPSTWAHTHTMQEVFKESFKRPEVLKSVKNFHLLKSHSPHHIQICCTDDTCKNQWCLCAVLSPPLLLIWSRALTALHLQTEMLSTVFLMHQIWMAEGITT